MNEMTFEDDYIDAAGVRTHYLRAGDPDLPTTVLIHGGGAGADARGNWSTVIPLLSDDFHVIAYDMPGFGDTDKPDPARFDYSQGARNRHLAAFVEALGRGPVNLVGNSMGGATSLGLAVDRPDLVSRLVLMGSAGLNAELSPALMPIINYDFTPDGMRALINALTGDGFVTDEELVRYRHERSCDESTRSAYGAIMTWIKEQGGLFYDDDYIRRVEAPTLIVNGKQDLVVPLENAYRFLELIDNSWAYIIAHCGHWAMLEATDDFVWSTRAFLLGRA